MHMDKRIFRYSEGISPTKVVSGGWSSTASNGKDMYDISGRLSVYVLPFSPPCYGCLGNLFPLSFGLYCMQHATNDLFLVFFRLTQILRAREASSPSLALYSCVIKHNWEFLAACYLGMLCKTCGISSSAPRKRLAWISKKKKHHRSWPVCFVK